MLLFVEVTWLLHDLKVIEVPLLSRYEMNLRTQTIGEVVSTKKNLRRRSLNSIVWEESKPSDTLYFYDSVLTLEQSSAHLKLHDQTEITISENTLIVLEPREQSSTDQIRLKLARGDLQTKNVASNTVIEARDYTVQVEKGASVKLRSLDQGKMEVELLEGQMQINTGAETLTFSDEQIVSLDEKIGPTTLNIDHDIHWVEPEIKRIYSHEFPVTENLKWKGQAQTLHITNAQKVSSSLEISAAQETAQLKFDEGTHHLRLANKNGVSKTLTVEVRRAPVLHLFSPLPRDRIPVSEKISFAWSYLESAERYLLQISPSPEFSDLTTVHESKSNSFEAVMEREGLHYWRVLAVDELGSIIPSLYSSPVFSIKDPFAAPKLKTPEARQPAQDDSALLDPDSFQKNWIEKIWSWILPQAHAQASKSKKKRDEYEAVFEWEAVAGADHYVIEIDRQPDFKKPIVIQKVNKPVYLWKNMTLGLYYWRVSAGSRDGRMGLFSDPGTADLTHLAKQEVKTNFITASPGVHVRKSEPSSTNLDLSKDTLPELKVAEVTPSPTPSPTPAPVVDRSEEESGVKLGTFYYAIGYESQMLTGDANSSARLGGLSPMRIGVNFDIPVNEQSDIWVDAEAHHNKWKPRSTSEYPFQAELGENSGRLSLHYRNFVWPMHFGLTVSAASLLKRADLESLTLQDRTLLGPSVGFSIRYSDLFSTQQLFLLGFTLGLSELRSITQPNWTFQLKSGFDLILGVQIELTIQSHSNGTNYKVFGGGLTGVRW